MFMALLCALPALALGWTDPASADPWHAALVAGNSLHDYAAHPWTAWTAAWVHASATHLAANLLGTLLVALLGVAARVSVRSSWAWAAAWPCTQLLLLVVPGLTSCVGLSGVLHAGVAVIVVHLLWPPPGVSVDRTERLCGALLLLGLLSKIALERPWAAALTYHPLLGLQVVPAVHLSGALSGTVMALAARILLTRRR